MRVLMTWRPMALAIFLILQFAGMGPAIASGEDAYQKAKNSFEAGHQSEAAKWLEVAVAKGHQAAQLPLAAMYRDGVGVDKDFERALSLFMSAAEYGYPSAQFSLGVMYRLGEGVERDYSEALKWYRMAAKQGDAEAQNSLGVMYESGRGLKSNMVWAYVWYDNAAQNGSQRGKNNRRRLSRNLSGADLLRAQRLAVRCLAGKHRDCE